jgi:adenylate cyclase
MELSAAKNEIEEIKKKIAENQQLIDSLNEKLQRRTDEVKIIQSISSEILNSLDLDRIFQKTMELLDDVFGFNHSMILLKVPNEDKVKVSASRGYETLGLGAEVEFGKGVIGVVANKKKILRMVGMPYRMRYVQTVTSESNYTSDSAPIELPGLKNVKSQIAIPLLLKDRLIGVYAVESEQVNAFKAIDEVILTVVGNQIASAIDNASAYKTQQLLTQAYSRFVPKELLALLQKNSILETQLADQTQGLYTIMFSDIRDFTNLSEQMSPAENFEFINEYLGFIAPVIEQYNGFIDKFIGDAIMAIFPGCPSDAVQAGIEMQERLAQFNSQRIEQHKEPIKTGIGIHSSTIMAGIIGSKDRMEGTVIGDGVNLASRIEGLTKSLGHSLLISEATFKLLSEELSSKFEFLAKVKVKGKLEEVEVYKTR